MITEGIGPGAISSTYKLNVVREIDVRPQFPSTAQMDLKYFAGDAVANEMPTSTRGNGASTTWVYSMARRGANQPDTVPFNNFLGIGLRDADGTLDGSPADPTGPTDPDNDGVFTFADNNAVATAGFIATNTPMLVGDAELDAAAANLQSVRSEVIAAYMVQDSDLNFQTTSGVFADTASIPVNIYVYRDVTLETIRVGTPAEIETDTSIQNPITVDADTVSDLGDSAKQVKDDDWAYTYKDGDENLKYTFQVSYLATSTTVSSTARSAETPATVTVVSPADIDPDTAGHQVKLVTGDNPVTFKVVNGNLEATHEINLEKPGLKASGIEVFIHTDETQLGAALGTMPVKLEPEFDPENTGPYSAMVESYISQVRFTAATDIPGPVEFWLNTNRFQTTPNYLVGDLLKFEDEGPNVFEVELRLNGTEITYTFNIVRNSADRPVFAADDGVSSVVYVVGDAVDIELPAGSGGNGTLMHTLSGNLPEGLTHTTTADDVDKIIGTVMLSRGSSASYPLMWTVKDSDSDETADDESSISFTIGVSRDPADRTAVIPGGGDGTTTPPAYGPGETPTTLQNVRVTFEQDGALRYAAFNPVFSPGNTGPYTVSVPHNYTDANVTAIATDRDARISINSVSLSSSETNAVTKPLAADEKSLTITVRNTGHTTMNYVLNLVAGGNDRPGFADPNAIPHQTYPIGEAVMLQLPEGTGGDTTPDIGLTYALGDSYRNDLPDGLTFDADARTLSGMARLSIAGAAQEVFNMVYQVMDADLSTSSAPIMFNIRVCDPDAAGIVNCTMTDQPMETTTPPVMEVTELTAMRSADGMSVDLEWPAVSGATRHIVFLISGASLEAEGAALEDYDLITDGSATTHTFSGLDAAQDYTIVLVSGTPGWALPWDEAMSAGN